VADDVPIADSAAMSDDEPTVLRLVDAADTFGRPRVRWAIRSGRWQRPAARVVVRHSGPLSYLEQLQVAALSGPHGTVLAGLTAATLGGLAGFRTEAIHVLVPHGARSASSPSGLVMHRTRLPIDMVGDPPRTPLERSIVDAASWSGRPRLARALVLAAVQQRLTTPTRLAAALNGPGHRRRAALIRESIADAAGGVESLPERDFGRLLASAGLPLPTRQQPVRTPAGRFRLDAAFEPWGVAVEIDGAQHRDPQQSDYDLRRQNELMAAGRQLLRFSSYQVRHEPGDVAEVLARTLARRPT
jgi:Protein of unknown function (DUF559)